MSATSDSFDDGWATGFGFDPLANEMEAHLDIRDEPTSLRITEPGGARWIELHWGDICAMQPKLRELERIVQAIPRGSKSWRRWESIKKTFQGWVGWFAHDCHPQLATPQAYDAVYSHLRKVWEERA